MTFYKEGDILAVESLMLGSDRSADGKVIQGNVGETVTFGELLYLHQTDGKFYKAKADSDLTMPCLSMSLGKENDNGVAYMLLEGLVRNDSWTLEKGKQYYVDYNTGGRIAVSVRSEVYKQPIGCAITGSIMRFHPGSQYDRYRTLSDLKIDVNGLYSQQTYSMQYLVTERGEHTITKGGKHPRLRILNAFAVLADDTERNQHITLVSGGEQISKTIELKASERIGKVCSIEIIKRKISFVSDIAIEASSNRQTIISLHVESAANDEDI